MRASLIPPCDHGLANDVGDPARHPVFGVSPARERFSHQREECPRDRVRVQLETSACGSGLADHDDHAVARDSIHLIGRLSDARLDLDGFAQRAIERSGRAMNDLAKGGLDRAGPAKIERVQPLDEALAFAFEDRERDLGFVGKVVVEGADAQSGFDTNVAYCGLGVAALGERRRRSVDQPRARRLGPVLPGTGVIRR